LDVGDRFGYPRFGDVLLFSSPSFIVIYNAKSLFLVAILFVGLHVPRVSGIEVVVDYSYDTEGFFSEPVRRTAIEAVASRYSRVITSELTAVGPTLDQTPWRIGFEHPGNGESFQISTAVDQGSDPLFDAADNAADVYGFPGLEANQWILYAGARNLASTAVGGTATGLNFSTVFDDLEGPLHRGVITNTPDDSASDLPAWGGAISFDLDVNWHFELEEESGNGAVDFYSIAMHEVGHALGLGTQWNQWNEHIVGGSSFQGANAVEAYNSDNNTTVTDLSLNGGGDPHWQDGVYLSHIFQPGEPNLVGTVGDGLQDLLLEPIANFTSSKSRFELTNVDAAALVDLGWSILEASSDPLDLNGDGDVNPADVDLACSAGSDLQPYFSALNSLQGDLDFSTAVGFGDFLILSSNFGLDGTYSMGDVNCNATVGFDDFLILSSVFGESARIAAVPEPSGLPLAYIAFPVIGYALRTGRSRLRV